MSSHAESLVTVLINGRDGYIGFGKGGWNRRCHCESDPCRQGACSDGTIHPSPRHGAKVERQLEFLSFANFASVSLLDTKAGCHLNRERTTTDVLINGPSSCDGTRLTNGDLSWLNISDLSMCACITTILPCDRQCATGGGSSSGDNGRSSELHAGAQEVSQQLLR